MNIIDSGKKFCCKQPNLNPTQIINNGQDILIAEKEQELTQKRTCYKEQVIEKLADFQKRIIEIQTIINNQINEAIRISQVWMEDLLNFQWQQQDPSYYNQIHMIIQNLLVTDWQNCLQILENIQIEKKQEEGDLCSQKMVQLISTVKQNESSLAMAFNYSSSILVTGCDHDIKVWGFKKGEMIQESVLKGHTSDISCLIFSKKHNWFASGSYDCTIRLWKKFNHWINTTPNQSHSDVIYCLILNNQEDQLISCSGDTQLKVWKVNYEFNQIELDYTLAEYHTHHVLSLSLNQSETQLVSCDVNNKVVLWGKVQNRWIYQHKLIMDQYGRRISFISDERIILQQSSRTVLLDIYQGELVQEDDLNFNTVTDDDVPLFPIILNKIKQIIILKHNRYVYILNRQLILQLTIDCNDSRNYGNLSQDGKYLIIWKYTQRQFKVYNIDK